MVDHNFVNRVFVQQGGIKRSDKLLDGKLDNVMETLAACWLTIEAVRAIRNSTT